jgi:TonB family protein
MQEGVVALRLLIDDTGKVDNVSVVRSSPTGLFESAAIAAFVSTPFLPALAGGVPVKSQITVEVHFAPFNRGSRVSGRGY